MDDDKDEGELDEVETDGGTNADACETNDSDGKEVQADDATADSGKCASGQDDDDDDDDDNNPDDDEAELDVVDNEDETLDGKRGVYTKETNQAVQCLWCNRIDGQCNYLPRTIDTL